MLSGSFPRRSSKTPVSGKIGSVAGSSASRGSNSALMPPAGLREEDRRQSPPRRQRQRIGRSHRLEELDELLARRLLVPFARPLDDVEELVDRRLAFAGGEQRSGEIETGLMVVGVRRQPRAQLADRARRLVAGLGEVEPGAY